MAGDEYMRRDDDDEVLMSPNVKRGKNEIEKVYLYSDISVYIYT
jgi:hypothetical protein